MKMNGEHQHLMDHVDFGITRITRDVTAGKADLLDNFIALISIFTYLADIVTDCLAAYQYYDNKEWVWFSLAVIFIIVPSLVIQLFSSKWHQDDDEGKQTVWSVIFHVFQMGPVQRYCFAFWYGLKTICMSKSHKDDFRLYLQNWRDVTMLRLIESFLESAPQLVLQLYVLLSLKRKIELNLDWIPILAASVSTVSLAWSIVSYTHAARLSAHEYGFSISGYIFQVIYRVSMVSSRIVALVVFAEAYTWVIFIVCFIHWVIMVCWLDYQFKQKQQHDEEFCISSNKFIQNCLNRIFSIIMGFVYIFCFINSHEGTSRQRVMAYYILFFVENCIMVAVWCPTRTVEFGVFEYGAVILVLGGFLLGLLSMIIYYKFFHPTIGLMSGWLCCELCSKNNCYEEMQTCNSGLSNGEKTNNSTPTSERHYVLIKKSSISIPVDVEFNPRSSYNCQCKPLIKKDTDITTGIDQSNSSATSNQHVYNVKYAAVDNVCTACHQTSVPMDISNVSHRFDEVKPSHFV